MVSEIYRSFLPARWLEEYWQYYQWWWIWWWNRRRRKEFRCSQHELWDVSHISLLLQLPVDDEYPRLNDRFLLRSIMLFTHWWRRGDWLKFAKMLSPLPLFSPPPPSPPPSPPLPPPLSSSSFFSLPPLLPPSPPPPQFTKIRQKAQPPIHPNQLLSSDDFSIPFQLREFLQITL